MTDMGHTMWWSELRFCTRYKDAFLEGILLSYTRGQKKVPHTPSDLRAIFPKTMNKHKRARQWLIQIAIASLLQVIYERFHLLTSAPEGESAEQLMLRFRAFRQAQPSPYAQFVEEFLADGFALLRLRKGTRMPWAKLTISGLIEVWESIFIDSNDVYQGQGNCSYALICTGVARAPASREPAQIAAAAPVAARCGVVSSCARTVSTLTALPSTRGK
jgi:hypothetical protein